MTNQRKKMDSRSSCSFLFQAISMETQRGNCASVMSTKLLEEYLINLFETELDVLFLLINKLKIKSLLEQKRKLELFDYDIL